MPQYKLEWFQETLDSSDDESDDESVDSDDESDDSDSDQSDSDSDNDSSDEASDDSDEDSDEDSEDQDDSDEEPSEDDALKQMAPTDDDANRIFRVLKAHSVRVAFRPPFTVFRFLETRAETRALAFQILMEQDVVPEKDLLDYHNVDGNNNSGMSQDIESFANDWRQNISHESMQQLDKHSQQNRYNVHSLPKPPPLVTSYHAVSQPSNSSIENSGSSVAHRFDSSPYNNPRTQDESTLRRHNEENVPPLETNEQTLKKLTKLETFTYRTPGLPLSEQNVSLGVRVNNSGRPHASDGGGGHNTSRSFPFHRQSSDTPIPAPPSGSMNITGTPYDAQQQQQPMGGNRLSQYQRVMDNYGNIL
mmetsp:Transcript_1886/g.6714  ORF Transcript_1886/g.6714 Transcript_1886/m.6714 type:complete len:362 (-) Transcript_1886:185-1270(-)|eukprot:CAMPEP_0117445722 /NCGR_PEP_ID=MMETSP0759-20121206/5950_1 /TAXON_ID=63605 /ORGANISM="Percolomonas cosmopolitus, Strain WS" /LENGTH=361 /DNA_ID=CAMNT_0005237923 /DNA_START=203 /DNA_END=1288 /DNA_ORIENTATION=-